MILTQSTSCASDVCEHGGVEVVEVELIEPPQGSMGIFAETIARIEEDLRKLLGGKR